MIILDIINDGTSDTDLIGNYKVRLWLPGEGWTDARVEHHTRSNGWDSLVYLAVKALQQEMKGGDTVTETVQEGRQDIIIRFSATGNRQQVLGQVGSYLKENNAHGLNMEAIELNGETVSSDEIMQAQQSNNI